MTVRRAGAAGVVAGMVAAAVVLPGTASAATASSLTVGGRLAPGAGLVSAGGRYSVQMQSDGNLVERRTFDDLAVWNTATTGNAGATLTVQSDGNVVVRRPDGRAVWNAGSFGSGAVVTLQDDGNLVVRSSAGRVLWSKGVDRVSGERTDVLAAGGAWTNGHNYRSVSGEYDLDVISGALYLHHDCCTTIWTVGRDVLDVLVPTSLTLQHDGNLVLRAQGRVQWQTGTVGSGNANSLRIQDDGNLVMRTSTGRVVWASNTAGRTS